jgi:poly(hydroxyalkanoate) depolymerase family esterase
MISNYDNAEHRTCRPAQAFRIAAMAVGAAALLSGIAASPAAAAVAVEVASFGTNPGNLRMFKYIPDSLPSPAPLVVVLHGCTQNARDYARQAGWTGLADRLGLVLAMAEQKPENNQNRCFNWFQPGDITRGRGEALSIRQMIDRVMADHAVDPARVHVTGLSAGGAMTAVMLATYPELFAGGGIIAGLPYRCARNLTDALQCMSTGHSTGGALVGLPMSGNTGFSTVNVALPPGFCLFFPWLCPSGLPDNSTPTPEEWGDRVRAASNHDGPFPKVSIWHGTADTTVNAVNATEAVEQWTDVHGLAGEPTTRDTLAGYPREIYENAAGEVVVELVSITGMGHGTPIDPGAGDEQCGTANAFVLDADVCSSIHLTDFWGLR